MSGIIPVTKVPIIKGSKAKNSLLFKSKNFLKYWVFKLPKAIRLNNHKE